VMNVNWNDAKAYTELLSVQSGQAYRLLTESEWEYCCRAGSTTKYNFGDSISQSQAQFNANATVEVGTFPPNAWGLHDMHGNVWEWCEDVWHGNYSSAPTDGSAWLQGQDDFVVLRAHRGGSWGSAPEALRSASRNGTTGFNTRVEVIGFRVVRTLTP
jgi:formylglycine-generating enzyme required for sulfatase activity